MHMEEETVPGTQAFEWYYFQWPWTSP